MSEQISKPPSEKNNMGKPKGLWANINAKKKRIAGGSGEKMRSAGDPGAPTAKAIKESQGMKNGGMVQKRYMNGGIVMSGRGVRDTRMG